MRSGRQLHRSSTRTAGRSVLGVPPLDGAPPQGVPGLTPQYSGDPRSGGNASFGAPPPYGAAPPYGGVPPSGAVPAPYGAQQPYGAPPYTLGPSLVVVNAAPAALATPAPGAPTEPNEQLCADSFWPFFNGQSGVNCAAIALPDREEKPKPIDRQ
jgi:hypothetical protein